MLKKINKNAGWIPRRSSYSPLAEKMLSGGGRRLGESKRKEDSQNQNTPEGPLQSPYTSLSNKFRQPGSFSPVG